MNQVIFFLIILNLLNTRQVLQEILNNIVDGGAGYDANKVGKNKTEIVVSLKHLRNFWRTLNILLINCETELILTWSKSCALADITVRAAGNNDNLPAIVAPTGLEFQITDTKLYIPVVSFSTENDKKEQLKSGFKKTGINTEKV